MWVRLLAAAHLDQDGKQRTYYPGDWVEVGRQTALRWFAEGKAEAPGPAGATAMRELDLEGCAVVLGDGVSPAQQRQLHALYPGLRLIDRPTPEAIPAERMCRWAGGPARLDLFPAAFAWLRTWEVCAPLRSYEALAADLGTEEDRARTLAVVHDLRVPVYEPGLMFVRDCEGGQSLLREWTQEMWDGGDPALALLRVLYRVKPLVLALPTSWLEAAPLGRAGR